MSFTNRRKSSLKGNKVYFPIKSQKLWSILCYLNSMKNQQQSNVAEKKAYQFEGLTKRVTPKDKGITFTMNLKKGPTALHTWFKGKNELMLSAYYVYITRKEDAKWEISFY